MSLQRVLSIESMERYPRALSPGATERRKMSFNPISADLVPPKPVQVPHVPAASESRAKRLAQVFAACIYALFAAGIVFGYAAIKPVLIAENVYRELCAPDFPRDSDVACFPQDMRLNLMFTIAAVATNVCALPVGTILDRYGPRLCGIIGSFLLAFGSFFMIIASRVSFDAYIPGYLLLALGGPFIYISSFHLSNCFPQRSGFILALLTGCFDTSSAVFLVYRLIYQGTGGWFTPQRFFLIYLIVPIAIFIVQFAVMPKVSYPTVGELVAAAEDPAQIPVPASEDTDPHHRDEYIAEQAKLRRESVISEITPLLGGHQGEERTRKKEVQKRHISGVWGAQHGRPAWDQIRTWWFALMTAFVVIQMTRINYFVATVRSQYDYLLGPAAAERINHVFDIALPAGGVASVPFIGLILDGLSTAACLALLVGTATGIGVLGLVRAEWAAYANIVLFVLYRPFYYTAVSDYAAKVFGFQTFGKVYGLIICIAGLFNFSQSALDALTHRGFDDDPRPTNLILLALVLIVGVACTLYVWRQSQRLDREFLEEEAEEAQEALIPNGAAAEGSPNRVQWRDWQTQEGSG